MSDPIHILLVVKLVHHLPVDSMRLKVSEVIDVFWHQIWVTVIPSRFLTLIGTLIIIRHADTVAATFLLLPIAYIIY